MWKINFISFIMLVRSQTINTSRIPLKFHRGECVCVVIAVDLKLGCVLPEVRRLLGEVFFLYFTIVWVIFTGCPSCDTTAISARSAAVLPSPSSSVYNEQRVHISSMKGSLEVPQSHLKVVFCPLQRCILGLPAC